MPTARITLTVVQGNLPEKEYVFEESTRCIIGRAGDCDIQVPAEYQHAAVSRHHCCLEIEPPVVRVHDLGSRNGTYVNGGNIGQRAGHLSAAEVDRRQFAVHELKGGDEIQVGNAIFRVSIVLSRDLVSEPDPRVSESPEYFFDSSGIDQ